MAGDDAWFGRRGRGTRNLPISWQGWVATILYTIGMAFCFFAPAFWDVPHSELVAFGSFALLTIAFAWLCARKSRSDDGW